MLTFPQDNPWKEANSSRYYIFLVMKYYATNFDTELADFMHFLGMKWKGVAMVLFFSIHILIDNETKNESKLQRNLST